MGSFRWLLKIRGLLALPRCEPCTLWGAKAALLSKQLASLSRWLAIWVMSWMKRFSKSFKGPFQILPNGRPGVLGCAAFGKAASSWCCFMLAISPKKRPHDHTNMVPLVWYSLHPHIQIWEWRGVANAFPSAWDDLLVCHPWLFALLSRTFQVTFPRWKISLENSGTMFPKMCKLKVGEVH